MKITGFKTQPARTFEFVEKVLCDICKREGHEGNMEGNTWTNDQYDVLETAVLLKSGQSYPEGTNLEFLECDICPDCFKEHLVPFLKKLGVVFRIKELDF